MTVLFVIADAYHDPQDPEAQVLVIAQRAKSRLQANILDIAHAIFDEIRRLHLIHFELRFGAV